VAACVQFQVFNRFAFIIETLSRFSFSVLGGWVFLTVSVYRETLSRVFVRFTHAGTTTNTFCGTTDAQRLIFSTCTALR
jgi:hypothetical protein